MYPSSDPLASRIPSARKQSSLAPKCLLILGTIAAIGCVQLSAQGYPYPAQQPYAYPGQQYGAGAGQYAYPAPPYGYAQPQYAQPQYSQPQQYGAPEYSQPQYAQPQQYADPQYSESQPQAQQAYPPQDEMQGQQDNLQPQPALNANQLEQLVAPIALYPDALLAQILTASTYPAQVAVANQWLQQMQAQGAGSPDQIADGANAQSDWDPSVKALTAFPQVLDMMDRNLEWTTSLGNAYYNQPQDVMQTVQVMRQRAEDAGNLQTTPQESVTYDQGAIELAPPSPQIVYVPAYNPWVVYGQPIAPYPGFSILGALGSFFGAGPIHFGLGIGMAAFDRTPFGLLAWGLDWLAHSVLFQHGTYFTHSATVADWGFPRGGARAYGGWARSARFGNSPAGYANRGMAQGYRPGSAYARTATPSFARPAQPYARTQPYVQSRPEQSFARPAQQFARSAQQFARPVMPAQQAYNRAPQQFSRPQSFAGAQQAYGYANRAAQSPAQSYIARPGMSYGSPYQSYRTPQATAPRTFAQAAPSRGFSGFSSAPQRSGGFQSFGSGKAPKSFSGGEHFKAPKAPKESHSSGGGGRRR